MRMSEGVEWASHACAILAGLPPDRGLSAAALAAFHALPTAYMAKHMQALARAGIVTSSRGARGGYRLARPAERISLWDIAAAIEGREPAFRCREIRRKGPCATPGASYAKPCEVAAAFWAAETAYREALAAVTIRAIAAQVASRMSQEDIQRSLTWLAENAS